MATPAAVAPPDPTATSPTVRAVTQRLKGGKTDAQYLDYFKQAKTECFADRWRYERIWTKALHYVNMRQWLGQYDRSAGWLDARVARGVPRPVTSKPKEAVQAIRSMFTATNLGVDVRPLKNDVKSVTTATTAGKLAPVYYTLNEMDETLHEGDFWFIVCGNVIYHVSYDDNGVYSKIPIEHCLKCGLEVSSDAIASAGQRCPRCQQPAAGNFTPAMDPETGEPKQKIVPQGSTVTTALSPLEVAFPFQRARWRNVDRLIRLRWRPKRYYEEHPDLKDLISQLNFSKTPSERSLQIYNALPFQTEINPHTSGVGSGDEEGIAEYELWEKPTPAHPDGLVLRVVGDSSPLVVHLEDEGLPGPLPYHDARGNPRWTFHHASYEQVGGRVLGSSALDPVMAGFDKLNRLDSIYEMMMTRMAIPQILKPKGQDILWLGDSPAMPGLVAEYAPAPGGGKPELWKGAEPPHAWTPLRQQIIEEIDAGLGTNDILRGKQPQGVEAFSAMQLLVEAGQARFAGAFLSRANAFREVSRSQMEIEREYGPKERTESVLSTGRSYAFTTYQTADLAGEVAFEVADGSTKPKTTLGERAAIEHLKQLGGVNINDPDTAYAVYQKLGETDLIPALDGQHQRALQNQDAFVKWVQAADLTPFLPAPASPTAAAPPPPVDPSTDPTYPFRLRPWYDANVHRIELVKWAVSDEATELFQKLPAAEFFVGKYLGELETKIANANQPPPEPIKTIMAFKGEDLALDPQVREAFDRSQALQPPGPPSQSGDATPPQGAGRAMANSNQNSAPVGNTPQPGSPAITAGR